VSKNVSEYHRCKRTPDGYDWQCKECRNNYKRSYVSKNIHDVKAMRKRLYIKDPLRQKNATLKSKFGITLERYEQLMAYQNGLCAVCGKPETRIWPTSGKQMSLSVDHAHSCCPGKKSCGKCVRGLLCFSCNTGIGFLQDDTTLLKKAIAYLDKFD
jgi:hypothetical protein